MSFEFVVVVVGQAAQVDGARNGRCAGRVPRHRLPEKSGSRDCSGRRRARPAIPVFDGTRCCVNFRRRGGVRQCTIGVASKDWKCRRSCHRLHRRHPRFFLFTSNQLLKDLPGFRQTYDTPETGLAQHRSFPVFLSRQHFQISRLFWFLRLTIGFFRGRRRCSVFDWCCVGF